MLRSITLLLICMAMVIVGHSGAETTSKITGTVPAADGLALHYRSVGGGSPALVFVHGWSCDDSYWESQRRHFAPNHQVVTIDLAGHGQ